MTLPPNLKFEIDRYSMGGDRMADALPGLTSDQRTAKPIPGKWSIAECICHLTDFDAILADRMKRIIALESPFLLAADESLFHQRLLYHVRDLDAEIELSRLLRKQMTAILRSLRDDDFERKGIHNEAGPMTLLDVLKKASWHVEHHMKFVEEKRIALGCK
jgi:hypothetical protein